jgi:hypothetical protein
MFQPEIPDKAGRGALCSRIEQLTKDMLKHRNDKHEFECLARQLDQARDKFHRLYGFKPRPSEETHGSGN